MNIVLGVSGGIAAYKAVSLARLFVQAGHELHVVPTENALRFVGKPTWEAISRNPVTATVHEDVPEVRHVGLGQRADLIVVAPATANTLARMTAGLADDLLGTTLLATRAAVLVAPAMHTEMWLHDSTQHNVAVLRERGVQFIGPESGRLTGDDSGPGRMSEPETIFAAALQLLGPKDLSGLSFVVSAGGTREPIDPVRFLGNRSSGRQGVAIAAAAAARGAAVVLLAANIESAVLAAAQDASIRIERVGSAAELEAAAKLEAPGADVVVMAAAVADYRVAEVQDQKIRKEESSGEPQTLTLIENPDILAGLVEDRPPGQTIVGFAAETLSASDKAEALTELLERGRRKRERKGVELLAVNAVGWDEGFDLDTNTLHLIGPAGELLTSAAGTKREAADRLLDAVLNLRG